jgi:hypothetical protein
MGSTPWLWVMNPAFRWLTQQIGGLTQQIGW